MFRQPWKKYLPVISILLKKSAVEEQVLKMNHTDFERAAAGRKIKFSFSHFQLDKGKMTNAAKHPPLAKDLVLLLQEEEQLSRIIKDNQYEFSMSNDFQLTIKNITVAAPQEAEAEETI